MGWDGNGNGNGDRMGWEWPGMAWGWEWRCHSHLSFPLFEFSQPWDCSSYRQAWLWFWNIRVSSGMQENASFPQEMHPRGIPGDLSALVLPKINSTIPTLLRGHWRIEWPGGDRATSRMGNRGRGREDVEWLLTHCQEGPGDGGRAKCCHHSLWSPCQERDGW